jgi:hypothetical protein
MAMNLGLVLKVALQVEAVACSLVQKTLVPSDVDNGREK